MEWEKEKKIFFLFSQIGAFSERKFGILYFGRVTTHEQQLNCNKSEH